MLFRIHAAVARSGNGVLSDSQGYRFSILYFIHYHGFSLLVRNIRSEINRVHI